MQCRSAEINEVLTVPPKDQHAFRGEDLVTLESWRLYGSTTALKSSCAACYMLANDVVAPNLNKTHQTHIPVYTFTDMVQTSVFKISLLA